jgi:putative endonuclease
MYYVYCLYSIEYNKIYIGFTSDLERRLFFHNNSFDKHYTSKFRPWAVIYSEELPDKKSAMLREKQLKSAKGRLFVKSFIPQ